MTDAEERLARLAAQRNSGPRQAPAQVSKIIAAGLSSSMVLGLVAVMGWTAQSEADQPATVAPPVVPATAAPALATAPTQTPVPAAAPTLDPSAAAAPVAPAPIETAPAAAPQPVVVELTVPAAQPAAGGGGADATSSQSN